MLHLRYRCALELQCSLGPSRQARSSSDVSRGGGGAKTCCAKLARSNVQAERERESESLAPADKRTEAAREKEEIKRRSLTKSFAKVAGAHATRGGGGGGVQTAMPQESRRESERYSVSTEQACTHAFLEREGVHHLFKIEVEEACQAGLGRLMATCRASVRALLSCSISRVTCA